VATRGENNTDFVAACAEQHALLSLAAVRRVDEPTLDWLNRRLRECYNASGRGWITSTVLDGRRVLRVTLMNPRTQEAHLAELLDGLAIEGRRLLAEPA
jgi:hypothetical protein